MVVKGRAENGGRVEGLVRVGENMSVDLISNLAREARQIS